MPEEFPVVFAFFLSIGVYRLARRQALVRRAVVVENIGRVSCICSDKTGTLTEGRLQLTRALPVRGVSDEELLHTAALASRMESADPMDRAVMDRAPAALEHRVAIFPFTEDRRREVSIFRNEHGGLVAAAKGAPETIIGMTTSLSPSERDEWLSKTIELASSGHKVIACARCDLQSWQGGEPDRDYVLLGLLAFADPLRPTAAEAVKTARAAGIRIIMLTGDHPATARAIAEEAGIGANPPRVIDGPDLSDYLRGGGAGGLSDFDVIARCIPSQKLDLVRALQASGEIVAVTGDGVNDVPALQGADIGIAMGERGTRSAREVASIVLLDDNFRTIIGAISEGRQLFENLKLSFAYLLMVHIPLVLTAAFIPFAGYPLLYLPAHIVWLELIIHPTALLVFPQVPSSERLKPVRKHSRLQFFDAAEWMIICVVGLAVTAIIAIGYVRSLGPGEDIEHARSMAIVALIVASATITLGLGGLKSRSAALTAAVSLASAILFVQVDSIAELLHLSPLHADDWLLACVAGLLPGALASLLTWRSRTRERK
jgi:Ca2+-transporting ATPase